MLGCDHGKFHGWIRRLGQYLFWQALDLWFLLNKSSMSWHSLPLLVNLVIFLKCSFLFSIVTGTSSADCAAHRALSDLIFPYLSHVMIQVATLRHFAGDAAGGGSWGAGKVSQESASGSPAQTQMKPNIERVLFGWLEGPICFAFREPAFQLFLRYLF